MLRRCVSVESAGRSDVYCLTVPETAAFAVAEGVIVHNCLRYGVKGLALAKTQPVQRTAAPIRVGDRRAGY